MNFCLMMMANYWTVPTPPMGGSYLYFWLGFLAQLDATNTGRLARGRDELLSGGEDELLSGEEDELMSGEDDELPSGEDDGAAD